MQFESANHDESSDVGRITPRRFQRWRSLSGILVVMILVGLYFGSTLTGVQEIVLAPGLLSNPHAQLWQGNSRSASCVHCHPSLSPASQPPPSHNEDDNLTRSQSPHPGMSQQQACAVCHSRDLDNLLKGTPHDLSIDTLVALRQHESTDHGKMKLVSSSSSSAINWKERSFQCNDCHREHQGRDASLSTMSNASCQACHQKRFHSFDTDHAEFSDYPSASPNRAIAFDHRSHFAKHFAKHQEKFDCNLCHVQSGGSGIQLVKSTSFEKACSRCHQQPLESSLADGVVFWQIPSIKKEQIVAPELKSWPDLASSTTDLEFSPIMRFLIIAELNMANDELSNLTAERMRLLDNLADLQGQGEQADAMIARIAIASRDILQDIAANGQLAIESRLQALATVSSDSQFENRIIAELLKGIPPNIFDEAYREWFVARPNSGDDSGAMLPTTSDAPSPFLPSLMPPQEIPAAPAGNALTSVGGEDDDLLAGDDETLVSVLNNDSNMLQTSPSKDLESAVDIPKDYESRVHLVHGGWMIDRLRNAIVYIPDGHADRWMQAYAEWIARGSMTPTTSDSGKAVIARCLECHIKPVTRIGVPDEFQTLVSAWRAERIDPKFKKLTRFDHQPHLLLPQLQDCASCHQLSSVPTEVPTLVSVNKDSEPKDFSAQSPHNPHDFDFMSKKMCIKCHNTDTKVQSCTLCHDYHVSRSMGTGSKPTNTNFQRESIQTSR